MHRRSGSSPTCANTTITGSVIARTVSSRSGSRLGLLRLAVEFSSRQVTARPATGGRSGYIHRNVESVNPSVRGRTSKDSMALETVAASYRTRSAKTSRSRIVGPPRHRGHLVPDRAVEADPVGGRALPGLGLELARQENPVDAGRGPAGADPSVH